MGLLRFARWGTVLVLAGRFAGGTAFGQEEQAVQTIRARATTVLVDVVVRQKDGGAVPDLKPEQFQIFEDGEPQRITFFREISSRRRTGAPIQVVGGEGTAPAAEAIPEGLGSELVQERFTALVFDRLSPSNREYAREAALKFVDEAALENPRIGVFRIDLSLQTYQFYTRDWNAVRSAIDRAMGASTSEFTSVAAQAAETEAAAATLSAAAAGAAAGVTTGQGANNQAAAQTAGAASAEAMLAAMQARMLATLEALQRDQQGYATTDGLLAIVRSLGLMPGRKTIIFFSEGVAMPEAVMKRFRSVIHTANRSNVAIYTVDAAGLRVQSTGDIGLSGISSLGRNRQSQAFSGEEDTSGPMMRYLERNEDLLRSDPHLGLKTLAEETGGFLIRDTNNLSEGLGRIADDMETYYLLAYTPSNQEMDGRYRKIEVKVDVPGAIVQYRKGYYAVDATLDEPILEYEAPAVALASRVADRRDFAMRVGVFGFPRPDAPGAAALIVDVPPGTVTYKRDGNENVSDFTIVALIRDEQGCVVRKASQQYRLAESVMKGADGILFYREVALDPGRYEVQVAAFDAISGKGATRRVRFDVPRPAEGLPLMSSLIIVNSAERVEPDSPAAQGLLCTGEMLLYPNLETPISKQSGDRVPFYFRAYTAQDIPEAYVELLGHGKRVSLERVTLPAPDSEGRIQFVGILPISELEPGVYTLRVLLPVGEQLIGRARRLVLTN
ncbi:MAG: hypothetical protein Kow00109_10500 [Acidobacteriota bacterium]